MFGESIPFSDYGRSVRMMSVDQWLQRATDQLNDPTRRDIIMSYESDRARAESVFCFVAAESIPYTSPNPAPYWEMGIGKALYCMEKGLRENRPAADVKREYDAGTKSFYAKTGLGR